MKNKDYKGCFEVCIGDLNGRAETIHSKLLGDGAIRKTNVHLLFEKLDNLIK